MSDVLSSLLFIVVVIEQASQGLYILYKEEFRADEFLHPTRGARASSADFECVISEKKSPL